LYSNTIVFMLMCIFRVNTMYTTSWRINHIYQCAKSTPGLPEENRTAQFLFTAAPSLHLR
jgi:hypothetical protein